MKKLVGILFLMFCMVSCFPQVTTRNIEIRKANPIFHLSGTNGIINFYNNDITLSQSSDLLTLAGGDFSVGTNNIFGTGTLGATGSRFSKGWLIDLEITNIPSINGTPMAISNWNTAYSWGDWAGHTQAESTITFTDITTGDASTGQHGYLMKLGGGTTNYLRADGTWAEPPGGSGMVYPGAGIALSTGSAWGTSITDYSANWNTAYSWGDWAGHTQPESSITFTDITTGDATTGQHGYLLKLGGGTTNYLRADGTWATPAGGMTYPAAGVPVSTGSAWTSSLTVTPAELEYSQGLDGNIQDQLDDTTPLEDVFLLKHPEINAQTGISYTLVLTDDGKVVTMSNSSANTLTVPLNSSVAFPLHTQITVISMGTGATTIVEYSGVTVNAPDDALQLSGQYSSGTLFKIDTNTWILMGDVTPVL